MFVGRISPKKSNYLNLNYTKTDLSCDLYKYFSFDVNLELIITGSFPFSLQYESQCCGMEKPFQLENHALLNALHSSGDKSEEIIGKHLTSVDYTTHRSNITKRHFHQ